jgi:predicted dehydrogenase
MTPLNWGILGAARIATSQVIPALQDGDRHRILAIASRDAEKAAAAAKSLAIPRSYGSYEALLEDPEVEAIYNPLPNHLHVPWSIRAMEAGKHVLCEKPIAMNAAEARTLLDARQKTGRHVCEAFMVRSHPQWIRARELVTGGRIGDLSLITGHFSYNRRDPNDVRSRVDYGGGVLLDIGCYPITMARWLFDAEPLRVSAFMDRDPDMGIDRVTTGIVEFPGGRQLAFTCAGQLVLHQVMHLYGSKGRLQLEIPFNPPHDRAVKMFVDDGRDLVGGGIETIEFPAANQFRLQADRFADALQGKGEVPVTLEDSIANMEVIDALFRSAESGRAEVVN